MSRIFNNIRKRLLAQNRFTRYLIYAIGEIVLVVIGILIAIQLNQWRNDASNNKQKQKILLALKSEFQSNLAQLDTVQFYNSKVIDAYSEIEKLIRAVDTIADESRFNQPFKNLCWTFSFDPINGALRSGISSGEIHLIDNDRLIDLLFSWEDVVNDSKEESKRQRDHQSKSFEFLQEFIRIRTMWNDDFSGVTPSHFPSDVRGLFKDALFEDFAVLSYLWAHEYETELTGIRTNNVEILELIEREIEEGS